MTAKSPPPTPRWRRCSTTLRTSARPTLVVVTGDHGEALGDHGEETHGLFAYESTLRIPLIVAEDLAARHARRVRAAESVGMLPVRHVDILPTILDAIGQAVPGDLPGRTRAARGRAPQPGDATAVVLRGDDRDAQSRLGAAHRCPRRSRQVHRSANSRAVRLQHRLRGIDQSRRPTRPSATERWPPRCADSTRPFPAQRRAEDAGGGGATARARVRERERADQGALHGGRRSEDA